MTEGWKRAMERDAVRVALPEWQWRDDDQVTVAVGFEEAVWYSTLTGGDPAIGWAKVTVMRADMSDSASKLYQHEDVMTFWDSLMAAGSEPTSG